VDVVRLLISSNADPAVKNSEEKSPYDLAAAGKHKIVCKLLKKSDVSNQSGACTIQ
jgi:ankyrin repeat protein